MQGLSDYHWIGIGAALGGVAGLFFNQIGIGIAHTRRQEGTRWLHGWHARKRPRLARLLTFRQFDQHATFITTKAGLVIRSCLKFDAAPIRHSGIEIHQLLTCFVRLKCPRLNAQQSFAYSFNQMANEAFISSQQAALCSLRGLFPGSSDKASIRPGRKWFRKFWRLPLITFSHDKDRNE